MKRIIELKHVGPRAHVRGLLEELLDRLEGKLARFSRDATSCHIVFEEQRAHQLYRASLTCHVPGQVLAAHEERRDAGEVIRKVFADIERQLQKHKAILNHEPLRKRSKRTERETMSVPEPRSEDDDA